jgi:hypothetical protein
LGTRLAATDIAASTSAQKVQFRDAAIYINSSVDGQLDIVADTEIQIAATTVDVNGALDVSGTALVTGVLTTTAATVSNGGGQFNGAINVGVDDTGYDVKFFGATTGKSLLWDESADSLIVTGTTTLVGTTNLDAVDIDGATQIDATVTVGVDDTGYDVKFFGATAGAYMLWDESADDLILGGAAGLSVNSTALVTGVLTTTAATVSNGGGQFNGAINVGVDDTGYDVKFFGATAGKYMLWDESADTLEVSGTVVAAAGTALLPSITTTGDLNTGMWFPAADTIAFSEGGVEALRIDSSGNVGIGTSSPTYKLNVLSDAGAQNIFQAGQSGVSNGLSITSDGSALTYSFLTGNVGIGTSSPFNVNGRNLHVQASSSNARALLESSGGSGRYWTMQSATDGSLNFYDLTGSSEAMRIDSSGIGTSSPSTFGKFAVVGGNAYADGGYFAKNSSSTADTILKMPLTVSTLFLRPNGDNTVEFFNDVYGSALSINQTNVGIGTTSPDGKLHIQDGSAGVVTAAAGANDLVIETSQTSGMSILCGAGWASIIQFGGGTDNNIGNIGINDTSGIMTMGTAKAGGTLALRTADSVNALTIDASQNLAVTSGNLSFANGQGIDFSATAGTGTSELLNDYEEGTWTPTLPNGGGVTVSAAFYTKIGRQVHLQAQADFGPTNNASAFQIGGIPFVSKAGSSTYSSGSLGYSGTLNTANWRLLVDHNNANYITFNDSTTGNSILNSAFAASTKNLIFSVVYITD